MTFAQIDSLISFFQDNPTGLLVISSIVIMSLTLAASARGSLAIRMGYLFAVTFVALNFARIFDDLNSDYFLNLGTEILGALLVLIVLSEFVLQKILFFPVVFTFIIVLNLLITTADADLQPFLLNLTTELLGAFILVVLLQRRDWLWNSSKRKRATRLKRAEKIKQREIAQRKHAATQAIMADVKEQLESYKKTQASWDVGIIVAGKSDAEVKAKLRQLQNIMKIVAVEREGDDSQVQCSVIGVMHRE